MHILIASRGGRNQNEQHNRTETSSLYKGTRRKNIPPWRNLRASVEQFGVYDLFIRRTQAVMPFSSSR